MYATFYHHHPPVMYMTSLSTASIWQMSPVGVDIPSTAGYKLRSASQQSVVMPRYIFWYVIDSMIVDPFYAHP